MRYCLERRHLSRTIVIALVVGAVLTAINHLDLILQGEASGSVPLKAAGNFIIPFIVSNLGLLSGRRDQAAAGPPGRRGVERDGG
ncbi:MAG: hypothetical protein KJ006_04250 [Thermoleophilia bacterium]|nr:hypothetical protein [Thermoleophilia bacterium]